MKISGVIAFHILLLGTANAETFECQEGSFWLDDYEIIAIATINEDGETGSIKLMGFTHPAVYYMEGFIRRWSFGPEVDGSFYYAFVLMPDGTGHFYDFSSVDDGEPRGPSMTFACQ